MGKLILLGGGGHCKVVIDHLLLRHARIEGILDDNPDLGGKEILGVRVLGSMERLPEMKKQVDFAVIAVTDPYRREVLAERSRSAGLEITGFIHPSAVIARSASISPSAQICACTVINPEAKVMDHAIINTRVTVEHDCHVGEYCHIAPCTALMGNVKVGRSTMIGASAVVIPNLRVGERAVVGAGSVVIRDIEDDAQYLGVPARKTGGSMYGRNKR